MTDTPPDWVLIEAAKRCEYMPAPTEYWRDHFVGSAYFRALCDMIAKYEQEPVDPDVEAVKRIILAWHETTQWRWANCPKMLAAAVAQYKKERVNV